MFEKKEEKLFEYAFGDLDARDSQIFEASLLKDEASTEEVKFLQSIKGDLASFRDIPEMQYSKERLRDAILGQGLKPSRPGLPWLNWVLAPGALVCTFALGYVLMNGTSRKNPTYVGPNTLAENSKPNGITLPKQELTKPEPIVATNSAKSTTDAGGPEVIRDIEGSTATRWVVSSTRRVHTKKHVDTPSGGLLAMNTSERTSAPKFDAAPTASLASSGGFVGPESPVYSLAVPAKSTAVLDATLIIIDKDQDSGVGTSIATEVNDTKNVVIGG